MQPRFTRHVPPDLALTFTVYWLKFFMLMSLSPLPCNVGSSYILYLIHIFIMVCTFQSGICHLTLTSFSWSRDFIKFTSSFHHRVTFSTTYNLGPHIYHGGYLSDLHVSPIFDLIFTVYWCC